METDGNEDNLYTIGFFIFIVIGVEGMPGSIDFSQV